MSAKTEKSKPAAKKLTAKQPSGSTKKAANNHFEKMEEFMTKGKAPFDKIAQDAKDQQEALVESGRIYARGVEDVLKFVTAFTQESVEKNTETFKSLWGCKTLQELTEVQSRIAQQNFDDFMAGATKLSEMGVKVASEAFEPINDQFSKTISKSMAA
ncbi:MAG TPA: phasin family protein [Micavibrio sp.]|jgi:phasin family protein